MRQCARARAPSACVRRWCAQVWHGRWARASCPTAGHRPPRRRARTFPPSAPCTTSTCCRSRTRSSSLRQVRCLGSAGRRAKAAPRICGFKGPGGSAVVVLGGLQRGRGDWRPQAATHCGSSGRRGQVGWRACVPCNACAAGNDGEDTSALTTTGTTLAPATCKNVLSVGASEVRRGRGPGRGWGGGVQLRGSSSELGVPVGTSGRKRLRDSELCFSTRGPCRRVHALRCRIGWTGAWSRLWRTCSTARPAG